MPYIKTTWKNKETKLNETNMNHIEAGIEAVETYIKNVESAVNESLGEKQPLLVSGTSIKTINGDSLLGEGNIEVAADLSNYYTKEEVNKIANIDNSFRVNGEVRSEKEVVLEANKTYELSGNLEGNIIINAAEKDKTILVLNNVSIKADVARAIYCAQAKQKTIIVLAENSKNYVETAAVECNPDDSEAAIQSEDTLMIVSGKNSELHVKAPGNKQHAIRASELLLNGAGNIYVEAGHDGLHGGKLLRIDSGNYTVISAEMDGIEAKYVQILGGYVNILKYGAEDSANGISSKETTGIITGNAKIKIEADIVQAAKNFNNIKVLEAAVEKPDGCEVVSISDYFGEAKVYQSSQKVNKDSDFGDSDGFPIQGWFDSTKTSEVLPDESGIYKCTQQYVYVKGYFAKNKIELTVSKTKLFLDSVYINNTGDAAVYYAPSTLEGKLEVKGKDKSINYIISNGTALLSDRSISLQENANYIIKGTEYAVKTSEKVTGGYIFTKGDGLKYFEGKVAIDSPYIYISIDGLDDADIVDGSVFELGPIEAKGSLIANKAIYVPYCQIGSCIFDTFDTRDLELFNLDDHEASFNEEAQVVVYNTKELLNSLRKKIYEIEDKLNALNV